MSPEIREKMERLAEEYDFDIGYKYAAFIEGASAAYELMNALRKDDVEIMRAYSAEKIIRNNELFKAQERISSLAMALKVIADYIPFHSDETYCGDIAREALGSKGDE